MLVKEAFICIVNQKTYPMRPLVLTNKETKPARNRYRKPILTKKDPEGKVIKLQLDYRTTIVVRTQKALDMWMTKYPNAKIVA